MEHISTGTLPGDKSPDRKVKELLINSSIKPCTYQGTKGSVEALDIKIPIKKTSIHMGEDTAGQVQKRGVSISLVRERDVKQKPSRRDRDITCIGHGSLPGRPEAKKGNTSFLEQVRDDLTYRWKYVQSLSIFWAFTVLGWTIGQFGPSFLDLQLITSSSLKEGSAFMTSHSVGYLLGSLTSGLMFDTMNKLLLVMYPLLGIGVTVAIIPWCSPYGLMVFFHWVKGVFCGGLDAVCNAETVYIWGDEGRSFMQALHFSFALGGILAPLATAPFLVDDPEILNRTIARHSIKPRSIEENITFAFTNITSAIGYFVKNNNATEEITDQFNVTSILNESTSGYDVVWSTTTPSYGVYSPTSGSILFSESSNVTFTTSSTLNSTLASVTNNIPLPLAKEASQLYIAYTITSAMALSAAVPFIIMHTQKRVLEMATGRTDEDQLLRVLPLSTKVVILLNMSFLLGAYSAIEDTFAGFLATFCVKQLKWTKAMGSFTTSVYWAAFGGGRFVGIFLVKMCNPVRIIMLYSILLILSFVGLYCTSIGHFHGGVWICAFLGGFALSVIFPTIFTWTEAELLPVTGKIASIFLIASSSGTMVNPIVLGYLMDALTPMWFCYLLLGESITMFLLFLSALNIARIVKNKQKEKNKSDKCDENVFPRVRDNDNEDERATEEERQKLLDFHKREYEEMISARSMNIDLRDIDHDDNRHDNSRYLIFIDSLNKK